MFEGGEQQHEVASQFLETLLRRMPLPLRAPQVDRGSEFYAEFEDACVRHVLNLYITLKPHVHA